MLFYKFFVFNEKKNFYLPPLSHAVKNYVTVQPDIKIYKIYKIYKTIK